MKKINYICMILVIELIFIRLKFRLLEFFNGLYWLNVNYFFVFEIIELSVIKYGLLIL